MVMAFFVAFFVLQKVVFMLYYNSLMHDATLADHFSVIWHGLPMDFSVAGYLTVIPALMILAGIWVRHRWLDTALKAYFAVTAILLASIALLDLELYGYWGFRLDMTPLFYFSTSPSAAFASATAHQIFIGVIAVAAIAYGIYTAFSRTVCRIHPVTYRRVTATVVLTLLTASLFIPIRGGVTVSTMNLSRAYFSQKKILNHAAINPAFSLLYSATHQNDYAKRYRFMTDEEAAAAMVSLAEFATSPIPGKKAVTDSIPINSTVNDTLLDCTEPDIYLVILASFSAQLMPSLGGEDVAEHLDSVAQTGICFTNFYANSFRTDRALPSILSGFPAQPSMSLLKYTDKTEKLPSIARELKNAGYGTTYYYGGDINFANINAYLISAGYDLVVCDKDFPIADRTGKWGAHDHLLFDRVLADLDAYSKVNTPHAPMFRVIQTSSSHEPFEVPYSDPKFAGHPQKNAFAYTDRCLRDFLERLKQTPRYACSLVIIVPDHLGAWPLDLPDAAKRHHVPLVLTGGAISPQAPRKISVPGSQTDIAATLLGLLGMDASAFTFSKDMLNPTSPHYAVFTEPSLIGIVTASDTIVYNVDAGITEQASGPDAANLETPSKAYLQTLYKTISNL